MNYSVSTLDAPEFLNLQPLDINPLMSACEIKVLYVGANRNHSVITKDTAIEMAKSLRGAPIVGYFKQDKGDFADHGQQVVIDDEGVHFKCMTTPYGFVAPDAQVWFQTFEDRNELGESVIREYLMTTGYLWTGQFEEAAAALSGKPQSMELDEKTLTGHWANSIKDGIEFFIINDAIFSKLCILGEDVEPCFEGASVTAPEVSKNFTMDDSFKNTLFSMMCDLKSALKGGNPMQNEEAAVVEVTEVETTFEAVEAEVAEQPETFTAEESENVEATAPAEDFACVEEESDSAAEEYACGDKKKVAQCEKAEEEEEKDSEECPAAEPEAEEEPEDKKNYALLQEEFEALETKFSNLQAEYDKLVEFKNAVEDQQKKALIDSFCLVSDEDKADVLANMRNYTLEEIESKLAVICYRKKINFSEADSAVEDAPTVTFSLNDTTTDSAPEWVKAVREVAKKTKH